MELSDFFRDHWTKRIIDILIKGALYSMPRVLQMNNDVFWPSLPATLILLPVGCQWSLATIETQTSHECQNIASAIVNNFEKCNITLLETKILRQSHVDQKTIRTRLDEIRTHSRSKQ